MLLIPKHLQEYGTGYNAAVKGSEPFCRASSILQQVPNLRTARPAYTDLDALMTLAYGYAWTNGQLRGTCVGQAFKQARDMRNAVLYILFPHLNAHTLIPSPQNSSRSILARFAVAPAYAAARVEVAGQVGRWDGCAVSWIAAAGCKYGTQTRHFLGLPEVHSTKYLYQRTLEPDEQMAVDWAASRKGVPDDLEAALSEHITDCPPCRDIEECYFSIVNGKPVQQGSTIIPTGQVNEYGTSDCEEGGGHSTLLCGVRAPNDTSGMLELPKDPMKCEYLYKNSWGEWGITGKGAVWIEAAYAAAMVAQGDTYTHNA